MVLKKSFKNFILKCLNKIYIVHNLFIKQKYFLKRSSYSHSGEDLFILKKFKRKGFYVDVGCHHPTRLNNCHLLYSKGWRGVNIDINKISIDFFNFVRKKDINICKAVSLKKGLTKYYYDKPLSLYNSLVKSKDLNKVEKIKSDRLENILDATKYKNQKIDFLSIDAEGKDFEVLKSLNFRKYKPKFICIEIWGKNKDKDFNLHNNVIYKYLTKKNYKLVFNKRENYIFLNKLLKFDKVVK